MSIAVDVAGLGGQNVTAAVRVEGLDPICANKGSCTTAVRPPIIEWERFDEYGNIRFNDEKARLDNFAIQLQNEPTSTGYIMAYGSCKREGVTRGNRARDYLVNTRRFDAHRLVLIDAGCLPELLVVLWVSSQGERPPAGHAFGLVSPCPVCGQKASTVDRVRRRPRKSPPH